MTTQNQRGAPPDDAVGIVIEAGADPKPGEGCPDVKGNDISGWEIRCSDKCDGDNLTFVESISNNSIAQPTDHAENGHSHYYKACRSPAHAKGGYGRDMVQRGRDDQLGRSHR